MPNPVIPLSWATVRKPLLVSMAVLGVLVGAVAIAGFIRFNFTDGGDVRGDRQPSPEVTDLAITIDGQTFVMTDGVAETAAQPGSATQNTVRIVGDPVAGDADGDGDPDAALLIQNDPGGSGTFYYAVVAINEVGSYHASNAVPLGDRIDPQTVALKDGRFVYTYLERAPGESMADRPSVEKIVTISVDKATGVISAA